MSAGTGGTVTGTALKLKEKIPGIKIAGVGPYGSILAKPEAVNEASPRTGHKKLQAYHVEGIGYDFVPTLLDQDVVDYWVKTDDDESFATGRNILPRGPADRRQLRRDDGRRVQVHQGAEHRRRQAGRRALRRLLGIT